MEGMVVTDYLDVMDDLVVMDHLARVVTQGIGAPEGNKDHLVQASVE